MVSCSSTVKPVCAFTCAGSRGGSLLLHIFLEHIQAQEKAIFVILMLYYSLKHSPSGKEEVREARHARMGESGRFYANIINIYDISEIANVQKTVQTEQEELSRGQSSTLLVVTSDEESAKVRGIRARNRLALLSESR